MTLCLVLMLCEFSNIPALRTRLVTISEIPVDDLNSFWMMLVLPFALVDSPAFFRLELVSY